MIRSHALPSVLPPMYGLDPGHQACSATHQNDDATSTAPAASRSRIRRFTGAVTPTR